MHYAIAFTGVGVFCGTISQNQKLSRKTVDPFLQGMARLKMEPFHTKVSNYQFSLRGSQVIFWGCLIGFPCFFWFQA